MNGSESKGEHLVLIVDCSHDAWAKLGELSEQVVSPSRRCNSKVAIESVCLLEAAIRLFHSANRVTVIAASLQPEIVPSVQDCANKLVTGPVSIVRAFTTALCFLNRELKEKDAPSTSFASEETRIILVTANKIPAIDFVSCMNCAFAAQKMGVVVDVVDLSQSSTPELLQLVHHTNGWYLSLSPEESQQGVFAHALLSHFVASTSARQYVNPPSRPAIDMRTVCFCHQNKLISIGFVCSVCLHVFCEKRSVCSACNSKVSMLKRKM